MGTKTRNALQALKAAFPVSLPILAAFWLIGLGYGLYAMDQGLPIWFPPLTAALIYSGSVEFILASMALGAFHPGAIFAMAFLIGARHLFYGIAMLDRYRGAGWRKFLMIYMLADETFAITYGAKAPDGVDPHSFQLAVSILLWLYWITGTLVGSIIAHIMPFDLEGVGFIMTAMFAAIFADNWRREKNHAGSLIGLLVSAIAVFALGPDRFMIPAMLGILAALTALKGVLR